MYDVTFQTGLLGEGHHSEKWIPGPQATKKFVVACSPHQDVGCEVARGQSEGKRRGGEGCACL